jgi:hypothetical protein
MRRKIKSPEFFSDWQFLGADIEEIIEKWGKPVDCSHLCAVIEVAIEPKIFELGLTDSKARPMTDTFAAALVANPDLMLKVIQLVRSKWHDPNPSHSAIVQKFITTHPFIKPIGGRKPRILTEKTQDGEIATAIELDGGPEIAISLVRSARQRLRLPRLPQLRVSPELHKAIKHLRSLGFCRHW